MNKQKGDNMQLLKGTNGKLLRGMSGALLKGRDYMTYSKWLGATTYSPGTYVAWCPSGLIYDAGRDVYAHFMCVTNSHYSTPNACEMWFNVIDPETLEHSEPLCVARTNEQTTGNFSGVGALGCCIKDGKYYMFGDGNVGYYTSEDGGATWAHNEYETAPTYHPWGCYVLDNGRMIMGSDSGQDTVYTSDDDGKNWTAAKLKWFNEPTFIDFGGGTVMAICRENNSDTNLPKPLMHVSSDYGSTWTNEARMQTIGYMGSNNCNAYIHDGIVELFVGCRVSAKMPQFDGTLYRINHYMMPQSKGAVDEFQFVKTVYEYKNGDNPQGLISSLSGADDFSTPVIAAKDGAHALLMFYAPIGKGVTHNFIALGGVPVDGFNIPKPMPTQFSASQIFTGNNEEITVCKTNSTTHTNKGYPTLNGRMYLLLDDIKNGGYLHVQTWNGGPYNGWDVPMLNHVKDLKVFSGCSDTALPKTPTASQTSSLGGISTIYSRHYYPTQSIIDIYARFKDDAWWLFYDNSWIRNYTCDVGVPAIAEDATTPSFEWDWGFQIPYTESGLRTYKTFAPSRISGTIYAIEYDKATEESL